MMGSLDNPPIVIRQSRWKIALVGIFSGALAAFFTLILRSGSVRGSVYPLEGLIVFFALGVPFCIWWVFHPWSLTIDQSGVTERTGLKTFKYGWSDFDSFSVWTDPQLVTYAWITLSKSYRGFFKGGAFGTCWELRPAELAAILNQAREKWGAK